ncbi:MAG: ABC transporter permease [Pseudoclavibacter sp.]|nr:ABC transporter permease [Pseudoclavibacter sp.]
MRAALRAEVRKLLASPVGAIAGLALVLGVTGLLAGLEGAIRAGEPRVLAKLGDAAATDWPGLISRAAQIEVVAVPLASGVVLAWIFAREFQDGTIAGLFLLPIGRGRIAAAKLCVQLLWSTASVALLQLGVLWLGLVCGYGPPEPETGAGLLRLFSIGALAAPAVAPVAWVATATRSSLAGTAAVVGLIVLAQIGALSGTGWWLPLAALALWALEPQGAAVAIAASLTAGAVFWTLCCLAWRRLRLG